MKRGISFVLCIAIAVCFLPQTVLSEVGNILTDLAARDANAIFEDSITDNNDSNVYVLGEVVEQRTETTKSFRMSDGSYFMADYGQTIHFSDENGKWQDYNNTLSFESEDNNEDDDFNGYSIGESNITVKLANNSNSSNLIKITKGDYKISMHLVDADKSKKLDLYEAIEVSEGNDIDSMVTLDKFTSGAIYKDILESTDLEYIIYGSTIKENIIVNSKRESYVYTFEIKLKGLVPVLQSDGSISLNDEKTGNTAMSIPAGCMYDAENNVSNNITYSIEHKNGKKYTLTVTADAEWINDDQRSFPVTIDPSVEAFKSTSTTYDTYITQQSPNLNDYTRAEILAGYYGGDVNKECHTLIRPAVLPELPKSAVIVNAKMYLRHMYNGTEHTSVNIAAMAITSAWDSNNVTWNTKPSYDPNEEILDYASIDATSEGTYIDFDITRLVQQWYSGAVVNNGIVLRPISGNGVGRIYFGSSDYSSAVFPHLIVSYRDTKGLEGIWTYSSHTAAGAGVGYINGFNGNLVFVHYDMSTEGSILPISISHVYNSYLAGKSFTVNSNDINAPITADYSNMMVGNGWKLSIQETLIPKTIDELEWYVYNDADGTELYFYYDESENAYLSEDGYGLKITVSSTQKTLADDYGNEKVFDTNGRLIQIKDIHGNIKKLNYNSIGQITSITYTPAKKTESITQINLYYNSANALYKIENAYNTSDTVEFGYSETYNGAASVNNSGYLRTIAYKNGTTVIESYSYAYNSDGTLRYAFDNHSYYGINYTYTDYCGNKRVSKVSENSFEVDGQTIGFSYKDDGFSMRSSGNDDIYNNSDDILTHYVFDNFGRAVCAYSTNSDETEIYGTSYAEYTQNTSGSKQNNKITVDLVKGSDSENLAANNNCESLTSWTNSYSGSGYSVSLSSDEKFYGNNSFKFVSTNGSSGYTREYQSVTISEAGTYTFSAYVKAEKVATTSNGGAYIVFNGVESEHIVGTTTEEIQNGWRRISVTANIAQSGTYTIQLKLSNCTGTAYFDCVQLEKGNAPSSINLARINVWDSTYSIIGSVSDTVFGSVGRTYGSASAQQHIFQNVPLNVPCNTTFMLSAWVKASSADVTYKTDISSDDDPKSNRRFGLAAKLTYSDGTTSDHYMPFNQDITDWQYGALAIIPEAKAEGVTVTSAYIYIDYSYNVNTIYFDKICFSAEPAQTYSYDQNGNLTAVIDIEGNESLIEYATNGIDLQKNTTVTGETYEYTYYKTAGDVSTHIVESATRTADGNTQTLNYEYDDFGNVTSTLLTASGRTEKIGSKAEYSDDGNYLTSVFDSLGNETKYSYDSVTKLLKFIEDANSNQTAYLYDNHDRTTTVYLDADEDGIVDTSESAVNYIYNANNRLTGITTDTTAYTFGYTAFGATASIKAGDYVLATYTYNSYNGKLKKLTYGNGKTEQYVYDHLDRLIAVYYNDSEEVAYTIKYNSNGNIYSISTSDYTLIYEYDTLGRLVRAWQRDSSGNDVIYIENYFDSFGRSTGSKYIIDGVSKTYSITYSDDSSRVENVRLPDSDSKAVLRYTYDEFERLVQRRITAPTLSHFETYNYLGYTDTDGTVYTSSLISGISLYSNVDGAMIAETYGYTYDANGNITSISKNGSVINRYEYDSLNQLIREDNIEADYTELFVYDDSGNLYVRCKLDACTDAPTSQIAYSDGTITSYVCGDETWGDLLTRYGNKNITYDEIGNPLNWRNVSSFTWCGRQLDSLVTSQFLSIAYTYNSDGIRTKRVIESTTVYDYILDGTKILCETLTSNGTEQYKYHYLYDEKGSIIGFQDGTDTYYYQKNLQGDIIRILNTDGVVLVEYTYNAYGEVLSITGSHASTLGQRNPFRYRGYYYDKETGFYYLNSRYYDPTVGRFLNADAYTSTGQGILGNNMFAYCGNNSIIRTDENGNFWWIIPAIVPLIIPFLLTSCDNSNLDDSLEGTPLDPSPKTTAYSTYDEAVDAGLIAVQEEYYAQKRNGNNWEHGIFVYEYEEKYYLSHILTDEEYGKVTMNPNIIQIGNVCAAIHTHPHYTTNIFSVEDYNWVKNNGIGDYVVLVNQYDNGYNHRAYYMAPNPRNCSDYVEYFYSRTPPTTYHMWSWISDMRGNSLC